MRTVLALAPRMWRAGGRGQMSTTVLAVLAFTVTSALALSVIGGLLGFVGRAGDPSFDVTGNQADQYVTLAWLALILLAVPLMTLGGAAARLGVSRRDVRLSTLRLLGVTPREVVGLTLLETSWQGLLGAVLGIAGYGLLMPIWTRIPFMGRPFSAGELWVGWGPLLLTLLAVPLVAAVSGAVSLRRVVVSPLGVARRQTPPGMRWVRALAVAVAVAAFVVFTQVSGRLEEYVVIGVMLGLLGAVFGTINLLGPWTIGLLARVMVRRAQSPATLLAGRRLLDDPRATWRVVGGLGLAAFVAGILSVLPAMSSAADEGDGDLFLTDLVTGGLLTLTIAFVLAAASAGIMQAASVLDRRREYALQQLAGVPVELFTAVRRREVLSPLLFVAVTPALVALMLLLPLFGIALVTNPAGLLMLGGCLVGGCLLVVGATEVSGPLLRSVLRETVVRPD
jgi:hypothetical protein